MSACEKCWSESGNADAYSWLLKNRMSHPCSPEEQAGPSAEQCPTCKRMTLHQYTKEPMCGCQSNRSNK